MMNKIYYWLSRNYYVWLVYVFALLPARVMFVFIVECGKILMELCNDLIDESKHMKDHWESEKRMMEQRMKKG